MKRLQSLVDQFIWNGRNRVARATITLDRANGGLGQIDIAAQYRALTGSLVIWVSRSGQHPLRSVLRGHIGQMSLRRWGTEDLAWLVSPSGRMKSTGSCTWQHICRGWHDLKSHISAKRLYSDEDWRELPLWRPHVNHRFPDQARCLARTQQNIREKGVTRMGDIMNVDGTLCSWVEIETRWGHSSWVASGLSGPYSKPGTGTESGPVPIPTGILCGITEFAGAAFSVEVYAPPRAVHGEMASIHGSLISVAGLLLPRKHFTGNPTEGPRE